jgi:addiction module HigA family antidote
MGLSQSEAARRLGVSRRRLHELVQGQRDMTPDTAIRCALVFRSDANFWLALQAAWDGFHAWKQLRSQLGHAPGVR